jgi:hypothetical protein
MWTQAEAIELCRKIEPIVSQFGCHIALTGGVLYKDGPRKDCDLIVYREGLDFGKERGPFADTVNRDAMLDAFKAIDLYATKEFIRVVKCQYGITETRWLSVDLIFPELDGEYVPGEVAKEQVALDLVVNS